MSEENNPSPVVISVCRRTCLLQCMLHLKWLAPTSLSVPNLNQTNLEWGSLQAIERDTSTLKSTNNTAPLENPKHFLIFRTFKFNHQVEHILYILTELGLITRSFKDLCIFPSEWAELQFLVYLNHTEVKIKAKLENDSEILA